MVGSFGLHNAVINKNNPYDEYLTPSELFVVALMGVKDESLIPISLSDKLNRSDLITSVRLIFFFVKFKNGMTIDIDNESTCISAINNADSLTELIFLKEIVYIWPQGN